MSFRGDHGDEYLCDALSILETLKLKKLNLSHEISLRFAPTILTIDFGSFLRPFRYALQPGHIAFYVRLPREQ